MLHIAAKVLHIAHFLGEEHLGLSSYTAGLSLMTSAAGCVRQRVDLLFRQVDAGGRCVLLQVSD